MHEYEPTLRIVMTPERFTSEQARDAFYAKRAATLEDDTAVLVTPSADVPVGTRLR